MPLCPWDESCGDHEDFYVDVGGHREAYELFISKLKQPANLARAGRVLVVTGPELSGKTALANRCVAWVRNGLLPEQVCRVIQLREVVGVQSTVDDRLATVCDRLSSELADLDSGSSLPSTKLYEVLQRLGNVHRNPPSGPRPFFVVLLPWLVPETAETEIGEYRAALAGVPGILCVAETNPWTRPLPGYRGESPPIVLTLRYLKAGEAYKLVKGWRRQPAPGLPVIREQELGHLENTLINTLNGNMTSGKLLEAIRQIYDPMDHGDLSENGLRFVEYRELVDAYLGKWHQLGSA